MIELWNLNEEIDSAASRVEKGGSAWNCHAWDATGKRLVAGGLEGELCLFSCTDSKITAPKGDEAALLQDRLKGLDPIPVSAQGKYV